VLAQRWRLPYLFLHPFAVSLSKRSDAAQEKKEYLAEHAKLAKAGIDRDGLERRKLA
jgi:hypothetical protein